MEELHLGSAALSFQTRLSTARGECRHLHHVSYFRRSAAIASGSGGPPWDSSAESSSK